MFRRGRSGVAPYGGACLTAIMVSVSRTRIQTVIRGVTMNHEETRTRDLTADAMQTHYDQHYRLGTYTLAYYEPA